MLISHTKNGPLIPILVLLTGAWSFFAIPTYHRRGNDIDCRSMYFRLHQIFLVDTPTGLLFLSLLQPTAIRRSPRIQGAAIVAQRKRPCLVVEQSRRASADDCYYHDAYCRVAPLSRLSYGIQARKSNVRSTGLFSFFLFFRPLVWTWRKRRLTPNTCPLAHYPCGHGVSGTCSD